jgi:hypothetical protein
MYKAPPVEHVWKVVGSSPLKGGRATAFLFRVGDDEATTSTLFPRPPGTPPEPGNWIEGIVVVKTLIWFSYVPSSAGDFTNDGTRWLLLWNFYGKHVWSGTYEPPQRFLLNRVAGSSIRKLGVILEPRFEFGPAPTPGVLATAADVVAELVFQKGSPPAAPPASPGVSHANKVLVTSQTPGTAILRFALGQPFNAASPNDTPLGAADLAVVARAVEAILVASPGQPPNTYTVALLP